MKTPANKADDQELYGLTKEDRAILKQVVEEFRNRQQNTQNRFWKEDQDLTAPEVYIAKPDDVIPAATGPDVGTGAGDDVAGTGTATVYQINSLTDSPTIESMGFSQSVFNITNDVIDSKLILVVRDKYGRWVAVPAGSGLGLVGGALVEDHPGRGAVFCIYLATWNPAGHWDYDCDGGHHPAVDWRYGVPYPKKGATGLFIARPYSGFGAGTGTAQGCYDTGDTVIYECVALDCSSPGECS
jgi:hypothetical protein